MDAVDECRKKELTMKVFPFGEESILRSKAMQTGGEDIDSCAWQNTEEDSLNFLRASHRGITHRHDEEWCKDTLWLPQKNDAMQSKRDSTSHVICFQLSLFIESFCGLILRPCNSENVSLNASTHKALSGSRYVYSFVYYCEEVCLKLSAALRIF